MEHYVYIGHYADNRAYAFCKCGWKGASHPTYEAAAQDRTDHQRAATPEADRE